MKSTFIKLQNELLPKAVGQELLIVNNMSHFLHCLESVTSNLLNSETVARDRKLAIHHKASGKKHSNAEIISLSTEIEKVKPHKFSI